jgi:hypothetical protein
MQPRFWRGMRGTISPCSRPVYIWPSWRIGVFATIRHRTVRSKGCLSNKTALAMIFKLAEAAEKSWRRLDGHNQLPKVILGVKFTDGIEVVRSQAQSAAA